MKLVDDTVLNDHYDVIVVGAGLGGLTCAYYPALAGFDVNVLDRPASPQKALGSVQRSLEFILSAGVRYQGNWDPAQTQLSSLLQSHRAVYCASDQWAENVEASSERSGVFHAPTSTACLAPAQLAAEGCRAAFEIYWCPRAEDQRCSLGLC